MGEVNFYLKKPNVSGKALIYLKFKYFGKNTLVYTFGETVKPSDWNEKRKRLKYNNITAKNGYSLNSLLDSLQNVLQQSFENNKRKAYLPTSFLKKELDDFLNKKDDQPDSVSLYGVINRFILGEIGNAKSEKTRLNYKGELGHLKKFEESTKIPVDFDIIDIDFYYKYTSFLKNDIKISRNSIRKAVKILKLFLSTGLDLGYTKNNAFKNKRFSYNGEPSESTYLNDKEIMKLFKYDLSKDKKLEKIRDQFVFACCIGQRFSDFNNIQRHHISEVNGDYKIKIKTQKTGEEVVIPLDPLALLILKKYNFSLPSPKSIQEFNKTIKEVCKECGLNEKGRLSSKPELELWECVSSHTARRSFATNNYRNVPTITIMKVTGHRSEKTFLNYIKVTKEEAADQFREDSKTSWNKKREELSQYYDELVTA